MEKKTILKKAFSGLDWLEVIETQVYDKELAEANEILLYCKSRQDYFQRSTKEYGLFRSALAKFYNSLEKKAKYNEVFMKKTLVFIGTVESIKIAKKNLEDGPKYSEIPMTKKTIANLEFSILYGYKDAKNQIKILKELKKGLIEQRNNFLKEMPVYLRYYKKIKRIEERWQ